MDDNLPYPGRGHGRPHLWDARYASEDALALVTEQLGVLAEVLSGARSATWASPRWGGPSVGGTEDRAGRLGTEPLQPGRSGWEGVLEQHCQREGIASLPWFPLGAGSLAEAAGALVAVARRHGATPAEVALAWLPRRRLTPQ